jgi:N-acetylglutamate synthase-like GNAT family acetyltransferase
MKTRLARPADIEAVSRLIQIYAGQGLLLPRTEEQVRQSLTHFLVLTENGGGSPAGERLLGCVALEPYGPDLSEIRSLAVDPGSQNLGIGGRLIDAALNTARRRKIARVIAVTHVASLFERHGFVATTRQDLPEKIARDCNGCPKARNCGLVALVAVVCPERVTQQVLAPAGRIPVLV